MHYEYDKKITFSLNQRFDVNDINNYCRQHPKENVLIEVQNTKGITSSMIRQLGNNVAIRIAGGFDESRCKHGYFTGNDYVEGVIYSKNETIKILEEIEKIEAGLDKNWSEIQILLYIYDRLKTGIMYDPKFEYKLSKDIRSLRGLISKQTVCVGYAMILKEFMDRNNISCEYVEGHTGKDQNGRLTGGHSWNIVNIDGKKYPIDLTWDNTKFRSGKSTSFDWLGRDVKDFSSCHIPITNEKTQDYNHTLSQIDPKVIKFLYTQMRVGHTRDYGTTTFHGKRKDGSRYIVAQVGDSVINNVNYYRYYYADVLPDGKLTNQIILYSEDNVESFINYRNFSMPKRKNYSNSNDYQEKLDKFNNHVKEIDYSLDNILFSKENIRASLSNNTCYIGSIRVKNGTNKKEYAKDVSQIQKNPAMSDSFAYSTGRYTRKDGSLFVVQQMEDDIKVNDISLFRYDVFEYVEENGKKVLKRNTVYSEKDFFEDQRLTLPDDFMSRKRLDGEVRKAGGYLGYYDKNDRLIYNKELYEKFRISKSINIDMSKNKQQPKKNTISLIPSFSELKALASKYEIYQNFDDPLNSSIQIRDIQTKQVVTDKTLIEKAMFANIWLYAAGVKYYISEPRPGFNYAFNEPAEETYGVICNYLIASCQNKGVIDTVSLLRNIEDLSDYKYCENIVVNLFRTPKSTEIINDMFLRSVGISKGLVPEPLYTMDYAAGLAFGDGSSQRGR